MRQGMLMQVQRTTMQPWLAVSELGNWLQCVGLLQQGGKVQGPAPLGGVVQLALQGGVVQGLAPPGVVARLVE